MADLDSQILVKAGYQFDHRLGRIIDFDSFEFAFLNTYNNDHLILGNLIDMDSSHL